MKKILSLFTVGALLCVGELASGQESAAERFNATRIKAEQGDASAQYNLGAMYHFGEGVPKDDAEAVKWTRKAAEQGDAKSQYNLGVTYYDGEGVPKNYVEAYAWFLLAKANGGKNASKGISILEKKLTAEQIEKGQARAEELHRLYGRKGD